ncbi:hypothetical protein JHK85_016709 [Glycine max]|nr:hypothetical protein JHK85_016709 [Glycine max]
MEVWEQGNAHEQVWEVVFISRQDLIDWRAQLEYDFFSGVVDQLGFAISYPLAVALDRMQDKCLQRYTMHSLGLMIGSKLLWQSLVSLSFVTLAFTRLITLYPAFIGSEIPKIPTQCLAVPSLCHQIPMEGMKEA